MTMKAVLTLRGQVTRSQFWTAGAWLIFVWAVLYLGLLLMGLAGGFLAAMVVFGWLGYTLFVLYAWTALVVGRLRHLGASLWWAALWPLTGPVFWLVVGVLPVRHAEATRASRSQSGPLRAFILMAVCSVALAVSVVILDRGWLGR